MLKDTLFQQQLITPKHPRTLVAVHFRKAFTLVSQDAIIEVARTAPLCVRVTNFIKVFLKDRIFTIRAPGADSNRRRGKKVGAPRGTIFSSKLFNPVMTGLMTISVLRYMLTISPFGLPRTPTLTNTRCLRTPSTP